MVRRRRGRFWERRSNRGRGHLSYFETFDLHAPISRCRYLVDVQPWTDTPAPLKTEVPVVDVACPPRLLLPAPPPVSVPSLHRYSPIVIQLFSIMLGSRTTTELRAFHSFDPIPPDTPNRKMSKDPGARSRKLENVRRGELCQIARPIGKNDCDTIHRLRAPTRRTPKL